MAENKIINLKHFKDQSIYPLIKMDRSLRNARQNKHKINCRERLKNKQSMKWVWLNIMKGTNEHTG
jgi:hypothetical protein